MEHFSKTFSHADVLAFLYGRIDYERLIDVPYRTKEFKLERMHQLLDRLGNPHQGMQIVHIAGTKGKGSTATMISGVLAAAGYRTGLYTSPHLNHVEQRAAIDGQACSEDQFVQLMTDIIPVVKTMDYESSRFTHRRGPTFFEITTAMAMLYFARCRVDFAVLEVGLGGRLDSTNVCQPLVSVITNISLDHTKQLGTSLSSIAREKAGIIKPGIPVVSGVVDPDARAVITETAQRHGCLLYSVGREFDYHYEIVRGDEANDPGARTPAIRRGTMSYWEEFAGSARRLENLEIGLLGRHQAANAAVALATLGQLSAHRWPIPEQATRIGLAEVQCPARVEVVVQRPTIVIDAAHNEASVAALVRTLVENFSATRRRLLFATSKDKDAAGMLRLLVPHFEQVILTKFVDNPRYYMPEELFQIATQIRENMSPPQSANVNITFSTDPRDAWHKILLQLSEEHLVCVAGSSFIAGEIRPLALPTTPLRAVGA